jgi:hypothetical protein
MVVKQQDLALVFAGYDRKELFLNVMRSIQPPQQEKTVFREPYIGQRLALAIIELRKEDNLKSALYNMAHVYGNSDASLYVFHGLENEQFVLDIVGTWKNVQFVRLNVANLKYPDEVNDLLLSAGFYKTFMAEFVLTFQTDSIIKRRIDDKFFNYEYIGGTWHPKIYEKQDIMYISPEQPVGNGGFSLRKISAMLKMDQVQKPPDWNHRWEDLLIVLYLITDL